MDTWCKPLDERIPAAACAPVTPARDLTLRYLANVDCTRDCAIIANIRAGSIRMNVGS